MTVTRFAPSPTGYLHLGHAYSALLAYRFATKRQGRFLLRLEDIDPTRCRPDFITALYEDLHWLGLSWEQPVRVQSAHFSDYAAALEKLDVQDLLYPCFCTRKDIAAEIARSPSAPHGPDGALYPGLCKILEPARVAEKMKSGAPFAWRLHVDHAAARAGNLCWQEKGRETITANPALLGDVVLARKETPTSYHLSVVVDDGLQAVTDIVRGEDLFQATHLHVLLQKLLSLPTPAYHHHTLVTDAEGRKFSKRESAPALRDMRAQGKTPEDIRRMVGLA
jgi:glutamyl-Q tRNA(Asp) synthetase